MNLDCDLLLLTEVREAVDLPGMTVHTTTTSMARRRCWAAVASRAGLKPLADPHGAAALAVVDGLRVCSSVLPWRSCGSNPPWVGASTAEKTEQAVRAIADSAPAVWGGDWNHALEGTEWSGSKLGRGHVLAAVDRLGLQVPTARQPHQLTDILSIDHVAVPADWSVRSVEHHSAYVGGRRTSDHDAYVVEVDARAV